MVNKTLPNAVDPELPPERRIALAFTPAPYRPAFGVMLDLDARLSEFVMRAREPLLGQMRLAWWRERLAEDPASWPPGDPLLGAIAAHWRGPTAALAPLADGWEELLGEHPLSGAAIDRFCAGRGAALAALADLAGASGRRDGAAVAGKRWALADFAHRSSDPIERAAAETRARALPAPVRMPRSLRGVALLDGLAARAIRRGEPLFFGRGAALAAWRLGMFGR